MHTVAIFDFVIDSFGRHRCQVFSPLTTRRNRATCPATKIPVPRPALIPTYIRTVGRSNIYLCTHPNYLPMYIHIEILSRRSKCLIPFSHFCPRSIPIEASGGSSSAYIQNKIKAGLFRAFVERTCRRIGLIKPE